MPGAAFLTMAMEMLYQKHCALEEEDAVKPAINDLSYRVRNGRFSRALVLEEGKDAIIISTLTKVPGDRNWHEYRISTLEGDILTEHCSGLCRIQDPVDEPIKGENAKPLKSPQAPKLWYKCQREIGMDFGPAFQRLLKIEAISGEHFCRTEISLAPPKSKYSPQSYYPIHPAALDGCFQTLVPSNALCDRTRVKSVMIPLLLDDIVINKVPTGLREGRSRADTNYCGRGRRDLEKNWFANTSVWDTESGQLAMRITGLHYTRLDVAPKPDPHTFHQVSWRPDITFFNQDQMMYLTPDKESSKTDTIIDLIAHKKPALNVLEVNLDNIDTSSLWFGVNNSSARAAYARYDFASLDAKTVVGVETVYKNKPNTSFLPINYDMEDLGFPTKANYDLAIIKALERTAFASIEEMTKRLKPLLAGDAFTLLVRFKDEGAITGADSDNESSFEKIELSPSPGTPGASSGSSDSGLDGPASSISSAAWDLEATKYSVGSLLANGFDSVIKVTDAPSNGLAYLSRTANTDVATESDKNLLVVRLADTTPEVLPPLLQAALEASGWTITKRALHMFKPNDGSVVLILDELWNPVMTQVNQERWDSIKTLVSCGIPLLWVTCGAQGRVTNPDQAMINGLFRVARQENTLVRLTTLDVQSSTSPATNWAIEKVLGLLRSDASLETEYMERNGILHIPRLMPDTALNDFRHAEEDGLEPVTKGLHETEVQVQLRAERLGTLNGLTWCETETSIPEVEFGKVEVEVMAVGVNFKDVAITMGIVPDDEYNIGFECAGFVLRLGPGVKKFHVGDRVCMLKSGSYCNRVRVSADRCHIIPASMSFEEAATIPSVYLCSLYAMYHLGNLKDGQASENFLSLDQSERMGLLTGWQSVLIHSATGGVGIACIQLAQYKNANVSPALRIGHSSQRILSG